MLQNTGTYGQEWTIRHQGQALVLEDGKFYRPDDTQRRSPVNAELDEQKTRPAPTSTPSPPPTWPIWRWVW